MLTIGTAAISSPSTLRRSAEPLPAFGHHDRRHHLELSRVLGEGGRYVVSTDMCESTSGRKRMFNIALLGYNRHQVDQTMGKLNDQLRAAARRAADAERQLSQAAEDAQIGFGSRIEQMIRLAEREAAHARTTAGQEAAQILEHGREEADKHRATADTEAEATRQQARSDAQHSRQATEREIGEQRDRANTELGQLREARDRLCAELAELRDGLVAILDHHEHTDSSQPAQTAPRPRRPDPREATVRTSKTG
jgi:hypothetical protein